MVPHFDLGGGALNIWDRNQWTQKKTRNGEELRREGNRRAPLITHIMVLCCVKAFLHYQRMLYCVEEFSRSFSITWAFAPPYLSIFCVALFDFYTHRTSCTTSHRIASSSIVLTSPISILFTALSCSVQSCSHLFSTVLSTSVISPTSLYLFSPLTLLHSSQLTALFSLFFCILFHHVAPWTPKIKSVTDCSHFDSQGTRPRTCSVWSAR